jgi:AcrR family transcriptional regulator
MAKRKDGIKTRDRILAIACEVFAEKGYHDATIEDICTRAKTNIAAVNYHFGSKDQLYAEVWRQAMVAADEAYPPDGGLGPDAPVEDRFRSLVHSLVGRMVNPGKIGHAGRLLIRDMVSPTEVIRHVKHEVLHRMHLRMRGVVEELLGPGASHEEIFFCEMSVVHQCVGIGIRMFTGRLPATHRPKMPIDKLVEALTDHITKFSLAGIRAVRHKGR